MCQVNGQNTIICSSLWHDREIKCSKNLDKVFENIVAPEINEWARENSENWIGFSNENGLIANGSWQIGRQGSAWWNKHNELDDSSIGFYAVFCATSLTSLNLFLAPVYYLNFFVINLKKTSYCQRPNFHRSTVS